MITDDIKAAYSRTKWTLGFRGVLGIALGVFIFARPTQSVAALALLIAIWALIDGLTNIARSFMMRGLIAHWWVLLLAGVVSVGFGIAALRLYPALSLSFAVAWTSLWLLTGGMIAAYAAVRERQADLPWGWTMTVGVLTVVAGVLALMYPGITLAWLIALIAVVGIVSGIVMLVAVAKLNSVEHELKETVRPADRGLGRRAS